MVSETATPVRKPRGRTPRRNTKAEDTPTTSAKRGRKPKNVDASAAVVVLSPVKTPKTSAKSPARGRSRSPARSTKKPAASSTPKPRKPRTPSRTRTTAATTTTTTGSTKATSPKQSKASSPAAAAAVVNSIKSAGGDQPEVRQTRKRAAKNAAEQAGSAEKRKKLDVSNITESGQSGSGRSWWSCSLM